MKIIGLIPARGGSKGIKNKNIAKLNGKPLLQYTADAANKSHFLDETFISTDDKKIYQIAKKLNISFLSYRPKSLSKDNSKIIDVLVHFLKELKKKRNLSPDAVVLLQPTSPLRNNFHIDEAIKIYKKNKPSCLVSICKNPHINNPESLVLLNSKKSIKGYKVPLNRQLTDRRKKQEYFFRNGAAIYIISRETLEKKSIYGDRPMGYEMKKLYSIDIDDLDDLIIAESILKNLK